MLVTGTLRTKQKSSGNLNTKNVYCSSSLLEKGEGTGEREQDCLFSTGHECPAVASF